MVKDHSLPVSLDLSEQSKTTSWAPQKANATGAGGWEDAFKKASSLTSQLSLDEKSFIVTGVNGPCVGNIPAIPHVGFKGLCLQDGPLSLRQSSYASVFPAGLTTAATWDKDLMYERGARIGSEFKAKGANIILGFVSIYSIKFLSTYWSTAGSPVAGPLGRSARAGRNWEGFSVDPYLTGVAFSQTIKGTQSQNVQGWYLIQEKKKQKQVKITVTSLWKAFYRQRARNSAISIIHSRRYIL